MAKQTARGLSQDKRRRAKVVVPRDVVTDEDKKLRKQWLAHPNQLDREGEDVPVLGAVTKGSTGYFSVDELRVGDIVRSSGDSAISPTGGTVLKVNPKTLVVESLYMGEPMTLKLRKDELRGTVYTQRGDKLYSTEKEVPAKSVAAKEPWEMTEKEYEKDMRAYWLGTRGKDSLPEDMSQRFRTYHIGLVGAALAEGKPVPAEVLKDYPDLARVSSMPRGYEHIAVSTIANEERLSPYLNKLVIERSGKKYKLVGVNDLGVLYWVQVGSKKRVILPEVYSIDNLELRMQHQSADEFLRSVKSPRDRKPRPMSRTRADREWAARRKREEGTTLGGMR